MEIWRNIKLHGQETMSKLEKGKVICFFDTETTGISDSDKIIQFSAQRYRVGDEYSLESMDSMDIYINPKCKLPKKIIEITGITDELLADKPKEREVVYDILKYTDEADILAGYNVKFDIRMLKGMFERNNILYEPKGNIDVLEMARDFCDQNVMSDYTLGTIADYIFPEEAYDFHNASEDIKATVDIFNYFLKRYIEFTEDNRITPVHLEKASLFINPQKKSQQRIRLQIAGDYEIGVIYYDIVKKVWSCKSTTAAKRLFKTCDMQDLERQFLERYGYRFGNNTVDDVAKSWMQFKREKAREK